MPGAARSSGSLPRRLRGAACALAGVLALAACERFDDAPRRITRSFWDAVLANDRSAASALALAPDAADVAPPHALTAISLGRILRDEDAALVETTAVFADERPAVSFHTHLERQDGHWRVDVVETRRDLTRAALGASLEQVRDSLARSANALSETLQRRALDGLEHDLQPGGP